MKILLLAAGNDIHSVRWANQLSANGNEVHLCYSSNHKPYMDKYGENVQLHELRIPAPFGYYLNTLQLKAIIRSVRPDIVNAHYSSGYGTLGRLSRFLPYLISVYGSDVYDFPYLKANNMKLIRKNLKSATALASTSLSMASQTAKLINGSVSDIFITPFGVDINKFYKKVAREQTDSFIVGSIKKLSPKYGIKYGILAIDYLINIMLKDRKDLNLKYYIYGEGEEKASLEKLVVECKLQDVVEFKGRIPNESVPDALNELDVFLGTSVMDSESFGVAVVEAMACEVPVIVTDVDGFKEVVDYGKAGIMIPRKDYKAMANEIYNLLLKPQKRLELGVIQRSRVVENYNWFDNVRRMESIYQEIRLK